MPTSISSIMTTNPVTITMDASIREVGALFEKHIFHHLLVVDEKGKLCGIISDRDYLKVLSPFMNTYSENSRDTDILNRHAHSIMTRNPKTAGPDLTLDEANRFFLKSKVSCLPIVTAEKRIMGLVTWRDVLKWNAGNVKA